MNSGPLIPVLVILAATATTSEKVYNPTGRPKEQDKTNEPEFEVSPDPDTFNSFRPGLAFFWFNLPLQTEDDQKDIQDVPINNGVMPIFITGTTLEKQEDNGLEEDERDIFQKDNSENLKRNKRANPMRKFNSMPHLGSNSKWNSFRRNSGISRFNRPLPATKPKQSTWGSEFRKGFEFANAGLKPLSKATTILSDSSGIVANIFNMYQTSLLTSATVKAQEAQTRANNLTSDLNQVNVNQKRADVKIVINNLENEIERLKKEVQEIDAFNINAPEGQRFYNNKNIQEKNEEIILKQKEIEIYKGIL